MTNLQQRLDDLRRQLQQLTGNPALLPTLERAARDLLTDAKNTPYESAAQALFAELARLSNPTSPSAAAVRGLLRRARIRIEIAGDDDDIDEAIDILAEALAMAAQNAEHPDENVIELLQQAGERSPHARQRVSDLFLRYGVSAAPTSSEVGGQADPDAPTDAASPGQPPFPPTSAAPTRSTGEAAVPRVPPPMPPAYTTSAGYPAPERELQKRQTQTGEQRTVRRDFESSPEADVLVSELTQSYYAGDYQQTVDTANRLLTLQPGNPTALEYRQKAEDNLIRGVVPDHRIPFDARVAYNRANSLVRAGNYEDAERLYREARDLAERNGILSWKDAEQALLEIQDLALAREMINEGDRLLAADNWNEAIRRYEGALRVVPNDPNAEERIETVRRIQQDAEQTSVQLSTLSGTLADQAAQLHVLQQTLTRLRQRLPNSQRIAELQQVCNNRLAGIKTQLHDQAQAAYLRAKNALSLEERVELTGDALKLLELAAELDPGDSQLTGLLLEARTSASEMGRARQVIERAAALIAQNFDNELSQARSMLAGLREYAQDERYRVVVNDLMLRYVERAEIAIEERDLQEADAWVQMLRDEPFRILGRRAEIQRVDNELRRLRRRSRTLVLAVVSIVLLIAIAACALTSSTWIPAVAMVVNPPSATPSLTPSITPTASDTPTPSSTPTASETPTSTVTPSPTPTATSTATYTATPTATSTPTDTATPTATSTPSSTPTPSDTPTATLTPSITPTRPVICQVVPVAGSGANVREDRTTGSRALAVAPQGTVLDVLRIETGITDGLTWYLVRFGSNEVQIQGWVRIDTIQQSATNPCPPLPGG